MPFRFVSSTRAVVCGLLLGGLCAAAGLLVVGMGHGWGLPLQLGLMSIGLWPLALLRLGTTPPWWRDTLRSLVFLVPAAVFALWLGMVPPPPVSFPALILFAVPLALALVGRLLANRQGRHLAWGDACLLALGLGLDVVALVDHTNDLRAQTAGVLIIPWLVLWAGWQIVATVSLARRFNPRA